MATARSPFWADQVRDGVQRVSARAVPGGHADLDRGDNRGGGADIDQPDPERVAQSAHGVTVRDCVACGNSRHDDRMAGVTRVPGQPRP